METHSQNVVIKPLTIAIQMLAEVKHAIVLFAAMCLVFFGNSFALGQATGVLTPIQGTPALQNQATSDFQFLVCGDSRPDAGNDPLPAQLPEILTAAQKLKPAFIIFVGDTIYGWNPTSENQIAGQYRLFCNLMAKAKVPVFNCPGNHEMGDQNDRPNATMAAFYSKYMSAPYGSFTYGNSTFIALNTEEIPPPGTPPAPAFYGNISAGYVSAAQLAWLADQLEQNKKQENVFIFMHHPLHGRGRAGQLRDTCGDAIRKIISNYPNVAYVIGGHEHLYFNPQNPNNFSVPPQRTPGGPTQFVVTGGAGAPLFKMPGNFHHYLVFSVDGKSVNVKLVRVN